MDHFPLRNGARTARALEPKSRLSSNYMSQFRAWWPHGVTAASSQLAILAHVTGANIPA